MKNYLENKSFAWHITKVSRIVTRMYNEALQKEKISASQCGILCMLYDAELAGDEINQSDLSKGLFLNAVNTHKLIARLKKRNLVTTSSCPTDKRCIVVELTKEGKDLIPFIQKVDDDISERIKYHCFSLENGKNKYLIAHKLIMHILKIK